MQLLMLSAKETKECTKKYARKEEFLLKQLINFKLQPVEEVEEGKKLNRVSKITLRTSNGIKLNSKWTNRLKFKDKKSKQLKRHALID